MTYVDVPEAKALNPGEMSGVTVSGVPLCIGRRADGRLFALGNICSHEDALLSDGWLEGDEVECPRHNSIFDVETGGANSLPATDPVPVYAVKEDGGGVMVDVEP